MEKKAKTIGLDFEVWRELKRYALERNCTLSEAVRELLGQMENEHENQHGKQGTANPDGKAE